ncbi:proprotein convertase P-domain-containing protein [Planctomycetota bacterium]
MDSHKAAKWIAAICVFSMGLHAPAFADPIHIYGGEFDLPITDKNWMPDAVIEVPEHLPIHDIDVVVTITHTSAFDLQIYLQSPGEFQLCLNMYNLDEFFVGGDYANTIFDDEASISIEDVQPPFTGHLRPRAPALLQDFNSQDAFGVWRLRVYDAYYYDTGTLDRFELIITAPEPSTIILLAFGSAFIIGLRPRLKVKAEPSK